MSFCVLFVCKCVLYYFHRVATQLQLTNISNKLGYRVLEKNPEFLNFRASGIDHHHVPLSVNFNTFESVVF